MARKSAKILVVEDSAAIRSVLVRLLKYSSYEVIESLNGQDALAHIQKDAPDLVLLDLSMPVMDGWTTLKAIRALPIGVSLPVVAVTAHAMSGDREAALEYGFDAYVTKPFDIPIFLATIAEVLHCKTPQREPVPR
jgi:CheY-like chemotaxis protein